MPPPPTSLPVRSKPGEPTPELLTGGTRPDGCWPRPAGGAPRASRRGQACNRGSTVSCHHLPDLLGRLERAGLPNSALVHVGWAVRQLCEQDGYLIATVQEALLQCYGGAAFALAVDRQSDRFRQRPRSPPSRDASQPPATPAAVPDARNGYDAAELTRHGCERRDASAAPAGTLAARPRLPRRRRGAGRSGAAALQPGQPAPEEDHAASARLDGSDLSAEFRNPVPTLQTVPRFLITGVCAKVRRGQLSRARQMLTAAALAPGNAATLEALTDTAWRPPHALRSPAPEVLQYRPSEEVVRTAHQVGEALRTSKRGSAAGLSGATVELYKLLLDDAEALESFTFAVNVTARAHAPQAELDAIALSRLTALRKPSGGVRGIATGGVFRRLVSRALARAFCGELDEATRPFQFALQTRAGTASLAAMLRAAVELDPRATVVSLDGRSAYDTISRATILAKLRDTVPSLLPFTRAMYARTLYLLVVGRRGTRARHRAG